MCMTIEDCQRCLTPSLHKKEMFWEKVDIRGPDECWEWQAQITRTGYGMFGSHKYHNWLAHRYALMLTEGPPLKGACVLHNCDNPSCCNPAHLRYGTQQENMADMRLRGRSLAGAKNIHARLDERRVAEIRELRRNGMMGRHIAKQFGVSEQCVCDLVKGRTWSANTAL